MGLPKSKAYQGDLQNLTELKRAVKRGVRGISRETCGKVLLTQGSEQSCATRKSVLFEHVLQRCSSGAWKCRTVAKKSPNGVLSDDIKSYVCDMDFWFYSTSKCGTPLVFTLYIHIR